MLGDRRLAIVAIWHVDRDGADRVADGGIDQRHIIETLLLRDGLTEPRERRGDGFERVHRALRAGKMRQQHRVNASVGTDIKDRVAPMDRI